MIWVPDNAGRFPKRPHYEPEELDAECESIIEDVLRTRHGKVEYPVPTDDLFFMLEQVAIVDSYATFEAESGDTWGESEFVPGQQPRVRIASRLAENTRLENPLRTTLTHEHGHVLFHGPLFELRNAQPKLFTADPSKKEICKREQVDGRGQRDWMEWQAGYCSGALLMPRGALRRLLTDFLKQHQITVAQIDKNSLEAIDLVSAVEERFGVSREAAAYRLRQLRFVVEGVAKQGHL
jgi:hypothetical protein